MGTRLFRYLFENTSNAIVMTGCTWDKDAQEQVRYAYSCEMSHHNWHINKKNGIKHVLCGSSPVKLFFMGTFFIEDAERLIYAIHNGKLDTVIIPYVAPIQRFLIAQTMIMRGQQNQEVMGFLQNPYLYMQKAPVKKFYFIYGNGKTFEKTEDELYPGYYLEDQDQEILDIIEDMEGYSIPVKKAGYIVDNRMLFYFGYFGVDLRMVHQFVSQYTQKGQLENFDKRRLQKMLLFYRKEFGDPEMDALTLFCSPLEVVASKTDSVLNLIVVDKEALCHADIEQDEGRCTVKCMLYNDSDVCRCHRTEDAELRAGVLLLGNVRMNVYFQELKQRYQCIENQIRAITLPSCGHIQNWNRDILQLDTKKNVLFWICTLQPQTSDRVIREIKINNARHRIVGLTENYGCCFNGFLTEKTL